MSCGCKQPDQRHGDERNIVRQDLEDAAQAANISADEVVRNIQESFEGASGAGGATMAATSGKADKQQRSM